MLSSPPPDVVAAAEHVSRWFEQRSIYTWELAGCRNRWVRTAAPASGSHGANLSVPASWALDTVKGEFK